KPAAEKSEAKAPAAAAPAPAAKAAPAEKAAPPPARADAKAEAATGDRIFASPLARRLAKEAGIDLASIKGSGPHGRIVKADVEGAPTAPRAAAAAPGARGGAVAPMSDAQIRQLFEEGSYEVVPHDNVRRII